ncbi:DUF664 domain-containing protein [Actinomycetota bacterium]
MTTNAAQHGPRCASGHVPAAEVLLHLDLAIEGMCRTLEDLGDELANRSPGIPGGNTAYAIVRHCAGVMEYWGGQVIADRPITRDRDAEFTSSGDVVGLVELIRGQRDTLATDLADFDGCAPPRGPLDDKSARAFARTQGGILMHIVEELVQHRGHVDITADIVRGA